MTVTISIADDIAAKLSERASASGQAVPAYTSMLVEQAVKSPTLEELLAPVQADFARSGMSQTEFVDLGRELLDKVRSEKKG
jgi:predicted transcriptional regulator